VPTADEFARRGHLGSATSPMPWPSLHAMSERDLRDIHAFLRGLGPKGGPAPCGGSLSTCL
jgi:hypothetical protein